MEALPRISTSPSLYLKPPDFDIPLEEFGTLPLRRLAAIRLLREGPTAENNPACLPEARLLLLHGHGNRSAEAKHCRADLASHFILRLACCGGSSSGNGSTCNSSSSSGSSAGGGPDDVQDGGQPDAFSSESEDRAKGRQHEDEADWRRGRREWFVRAERDLFEARLHWHLNDGGDGEAGAGAAGAPGAERKGSVAAAVAADGANFSRGCRLDALRIVYGLSWLQPVEPDGEHRGYMKEPRAGFPELHCGSPSESRGCSRGGRCSGGSRGGSGGDSGDGAGSGGGSSSSGSGSRGSTGGGKRRRDGADPSGAVEESMPSPACTFSANGAAWGTASTTKTITPEEGDAFKPSAIYGSGSSGGSRGGLACLSCPFEKALPLVRSRRVPLRNGRALLSPAQVPEVVVRHFEERLREQLAVAERGLPGVEADERVKGVLRRIRRAVNALVCGGGGSRGGGGGGNDNLTSAVVITRRNIDRVAAEHFPLCMRRTLRILRRVHHLKYQARLQLVSFLRNAGMEVGELLGLWREEFPKGMPAAEYSRKRNQYEYSLRHLYGLEGKRKAYGPLSCSQIASSGWGGSGEGGFGHGCPFHSHPAISGGGSGLGSTRDDDTSVRGMLAAQNLPAVDIEDIVGPLEGSRGGGSGGGSGAAVRACRRHFSITHRWPTGVSTHGGGGSSSGGGGGRADGGVWRTGSYGAQEASSPNGWLAASTRSGQQQEQEQRREQAVGLAAVEGEFLTQQGLGV